MNFLAHQFLSFGERGLQIGNLYGEIVRAKEYLQYPDDIQKGILLHRAIDSYTDSHPTVKHSTSLFHNKYGKYAPVIVDVLYDYFLIKNWKKYSEELFEDFVNNCYRLFEENLPTFPENLQFIMQHLLKNDWFRNYATTAGIHETLSGLSRRSKFKNNIDEAVNELIRFETMLDEDFNLFFPDLIRHCKSFIKSKS